jgi:hypothetical protein
MEQSIFLLSDPTHLQGKMCENGVNVIANYVSGSCALVAGAVAGAAMGSGPGAGVGGASVALVAGLTCIAVSEAVHETALNSCEAQRMFCKL